MPLVVPMLALAVFAQGTSEFMLAGLLPGIAADLAIPIPQAGLLTSSFAVGMVVGAPLMAAVSRRWPPRLALSGLLALFIAMHVVGAMTDSFWILLLSRVLAAISNAGFLAITLSTVSALVEPARQARALSVILGGTTLALIAGVPLGAAIGAALDWRAAMWAVAIVSIPALLAIALSTPRQVLSGAGQLGTIRNEFTALLSPSLHRPLVLGALVNGATFCSFTYLASLVTETAGLPEGIVPVALAIFGIGSFAGVGISGRFADAHANRIVRWGTWGLLVGWAMLAWTATIPVALLALALLLGAGSFAVGSTLIALSMKAAGAAPTMSGSFATASLNIGAAAGPVLGGLAFAALGSAVGPLIVSAALVLSVILLEGLRPRVTRQ